LPSDTESAAEAGIQPVRRGEFLGHPRGLAFIVFTEAWERFSFYGMQALLVLYMATYLFQPENIDQVVGIDVLRGGVEGLFGPLTTQAFATQLFGLYIGLIYFMPAFGGLLGDRVLGQKKAVLLGAAFMAAGHFMMAFEPALIFALSALVIGSGLLKGNLAAQVGRLYKPTDQRRDRAFTMYTMSINVGAFIAPLICGTLGELYGWHYGFGVAGIGMLVGIAIYLAGQSYLPADDVGSGRENRPSLQPGDGKAILALIVLFAIATLFWTAQTQVWNTYPLWIRERVDRDLLGLTVPITWFQSLDSLAVLVLGPAVMWFWRNQSRRQVEPGDISKVMLGCIVFGISCAWLASGEYLSGGATLGLIWPAVFHFICAVGYLYVGPIMLALASRAAPPAVNAMMVGAYYLSIFAGGVASGWLGRFYEPLSPGAFWLLHGAVVFSGGALLWLLFRPLCAALGIGRTRQG